MPDTEHPWLLTADAIVGQFRILRPLGRGGITEVYLGRDMRLGRKVALKLIRTDVATDVWTLGVILHELLAQERPFDADSSVGLAMKVCSTEPAPRVDRR